MKLKLKREYKLMKAYLINAKDEFIVEVDCKNYDHKLELLGCNRLELYPHNVNGNDIWTDEEGNLKQYNYFFTIDDVIVSGNAIILSCNDEGDSADVKNLTIDELKSRVQFMGKRYIDHEKLFSNFTIEEWK
tara:strand:+ start:309 stop:704 length:396 start_codon:yes stop_codon:yes gene_type:complete